MTIQFLEPTNVTLRNVNTRMEKHGEDDVHALDLAISVTGGNALLDMLHPDARRLLFKPLHEVEGELSLPTDDLPSIRFAQLQMPIGFDVEHAGMTLHVAYGATGKADMVLADVKLSKVKIEAAIEGGSVELRFNLSSTDITEKVIGKLSLLQKHDISITLKAPVVNVTDMEAKKAQAKAEAESLFNTPPATVTPEEAFAGSASE